jgi:hypothetical protein
MASSGSSNQSYRLPDVLPLQTTTAPIVPPLPANISRELTSKLSALAVSRPIVNKSSSIRDNHIMTRSLNKVKPTVIPVAVSSLPRPTKLVDKDKNNASNVAPPRQGWRRKDSYEMSAKKENIIKTLPQKVKKSDRRSHQDSNKSPIISTNLSSKSSPTTITVDKKQQHLSIVGTDAKRASSGYDSATDTSWDIASSPYSKVTNPRTTHPHRSSSGHGSDGGSSAPSPPGGGGGGGTVGQKSKVSLLFASGRTNRPRNRESFSASSGYESAGGYGARTGGGSGEADSDGGRDPKMVLSTPNAAPVRRKYFGWLFQMHIIYG